jgi:uncharacterized cofD-like protein
MKKAISEVGKILRIKGFVAPITLDKSDLCVELADGKTIFGETHIDEVEKADKRAKIVRAYLEPKAQINEDAAKAIEEADYILIGPGDLYTSIIPNLLVEGTSKLIQKSKAKKIFALNLMTKYGQTTDYTAKEHLEELEKYLGKNAIDYILVNTKRPRKETLEWYEEYEEYPVEDDLKEKQRFEIIRKNLIKDVVFQNSEADKLHRSIVRHDPDKLAKEIMEIVNG